MLVSETWKLIQSSGRAQSWHRDGLDIMRKISITHEGPQYHAVKSALDNLVPQKVDGSKATVL